MQKVNSLKQCVTATSKTARIKKVILLLQHVFIMSTHRFSFRLVLGPMKFTAYTEDLADLINNHQLGYHLYADDTQLIASTPVVLAQVDVDHLKQCVIDIQRWCASRRLQLNPAKTELIWFGSRTNLKTMATQDVSLCMDSSTIQHV